MPVAVDKGIFVDFPNLPVDVPGLQVALEEGGIVLHAVDDLSLNFLDVFIPL